MTSQEIIRLKILAPVSAASEIPALAEAGADEIYCGVLPSDWADDYGDSGTLTRRQGTVANCGTLDELLAIAGIAARRHLPSSLTLNVRYTQDQIPRVIDLAEKWCKAGGSSVTVSDLGLLLNLNQRALPGERHLSLLAGTFNSQAVRFFRGLGVSRVILPRSLSIDEMTQITQANPGCEFSAIVLNEKCQFIDGLCGFYHGTAYPPPGTATIFKYYSTKQGGPPLTFSYDPAYAGHGCQIPFSADSRVPVQLTPRDDEAHPACGACLLPALQQAGVCYLKIAGRGLPSTLKVRAVRFIRATLRELQGVGEGQALTAVSAKRLYAQTFGNQCGGRMCYYTAPEGI